MRCQSVFDNALPDSNRLSGVASVPDDVNTLHVIKMLVAEIQGKEVAPSLGLAALVPGKIRHGISIGMGLRGWPNDLAHQPRGESAAPQTH